MTSPETRSAFKALVEAELIEATRIFRESGSYPVLIGNGGWRLPGEPDHFAIGSLNGPLIEKVQEVVILDLDGKVVEGRINPGLFEVVPIYSAVFKARADVQAIVHTHTPYLAAFSVAGRVLPNHHLSLPRFGVRTEVPLAGWSTRYDGTTIAGALAEALDAPAVLHANHGVFVFGKSISEAARVNVFLEEGARILFLAEQLGGSKPLPEGAYESIQAGIRNAIEALA